MQTNYYPKKVSFLFPLVFLLVLFQQNSFSQELLNPLVHPKFVNQLPNPLNPAFIFSESAPNEYQIGMYQTAWNILGAGFPMTNVYGYGNAANSSQGPTYPGRTFVVQSNIQTRVLWSNNIPLSSSGHLLPVDVSLHWAEPMPGMTASQLSTTGIPVVPHVHGGHTESGSDGLPEYWFTPGFTYVGPRFNDGRRLDLGEPYHYDNSQPAGTIWYHDHGLGITRLNVYAGLAGFYIIRDNQDTGLEGNPLGLPVYPYEVPIAMQDRMFTEDGQLFYPTEPMELEPANPVTGDPYPAPPSPSALPEFFGDFIVVNGVTWPVLNVEPRLYRFRFLNGSDSRFYNMWIGSGPKIYVIGTDNALLPAPVQLDQLTIGPGERYDVLIDFTGFQGQTLILKNNARSPFPKGGTVNPLTTGRIMAFSVGTTVTNTANNTIPSSLGIVNPLTGVDRTRKLALFEGLDQFGRLQPMLGVAEPTMDVVGNSVNGSMLWDEMHFPITENPMLNDTEIWEVYNATADAHPIHLHLVSFQIINRQKYKANIEFKFPMLAHNGSESVGFEFTPGSIQLVGKPKPPGLYESGWKDTYIVYPGEVARLIAKFDRPGRYVWHCHILSHEDHEMMRAYHVGPVVLPKQNTGTQIASVTDFSLEQNYPNPFNPNSVINFSIPGENTMVSLKIYNFLGEEVGTLINQIVPAGKHGIRFDASGLPSGIYFYTLAAGNFVETKKMILMK
jgi:spore coat protein A